MNKDHSRSHTDPPEFNHAHLIYAPNSTPQTSTHAPPYNQHQPSTHSWGGPPQNRQTQMPNPQTPTTRFSPFHHEKNTQPPNYTSNSPHSFATGAQEPTAANTTYMISTPGWIPTGQTP